MGYIVTQPSAVIDAWWNGDGKMLVGMTGKLDVYPTTQQSSLKLDGKGGSDVLKIEVGFARQLAMEVVEVRRELEEEIGSLDMGRRG